MAWGWREIAIRAREGTESRSDAQMPLTAWEDTPALLARQLVPRGMVKTHVESPQRRRQTAQHGGTFKSARVHADSKRSKCMRSRRSLGAPKVNELRGCRTHCVVLAIAKRSGLGAGLVMSWSWRSLVRRENKVHETCPEVRFRSGRAINLLNMGLGRRLPAAVADNRFLAYLRTGIGFVDLL